ncbi:mitochondrial fission process protein 1 [Rhodnius prolixus]|uniref:Mitochondrial fission process protein 1 n=2 Tax=Rhodnius TaxID=13248 RepID=R4G7W3_RHOPR
MGEKDIYRDTPIRYLGYSNELGESFRSVMDVKWVWLSYGVASAYVLADTISKASVARRHSINGAKNVNALKTGLDVLLWQGFASVAIPGFVINRICAGTNYILKRTPLRKNRKWLVVGAGLSAIPFIIKPIDHFVDFAMNKTVRPLLFSKPS